MSSSSACGVESGPGGFDFIVVTPPGPPNPALAIAASRAGAIGILDLQFADDSEDVLVAVRTLARHSRGRCGVKIGSCARSQFERLLSALPTRISIAIVSPTDPTNVRDCVRELQGRNVTV